MRGENPGPAKVLDQDACSEACQAAFVLSWRLQIQSAVGGVSPQTTKGDKRSILYLELLNLGHWLVAARKKRLQFTQPAPATWIRRKPKAAKATDPGDRGLRLGLLADLHPHPGRPCGCETSNDF